MRSFFWFTALSLSLLVPGGAQPGQPALEISEIGIHWSRPEPDGINLRVSLTNPNPIAVEGPLVVRLYLRGDEKQQWRLLKHWSDVDRLPAFFRVVRDYFPPAHAALDPALARGRFQVRVVVTLSDGQRISREASFAKLPEDRVQTDGSNPESPVRVTRLDLWDTTPAYGWRPELGEVRVRATIQNTGPSDLSGVLITLRVTTEAGGLIEEFRQDLGRLKAGESHDFEGGPLRNYSLANLRAQVSIEHDRVWD